LRFSGLAPLRLSGLAREKIKQHFKKITHKKTTIYHNHTIINPLRLSVLAREKAKQHIEKRTTHERQ